ncbi:MAG: cation:proton antiporter [Elusimicrobia bacterium]|jgi:multicomponent Na+:H+ antiporter subunit F|nr:cation:proton antiporter [Elusimicrobiota bacterium]
MIDIYFIFLFISCALCIYRIGRGPTPPDRTVAIDILGTVVVGFSALFTLTTDTDFYLNIALSWALLSFIGTIALAKYLEGKNFDE